MPANPGPRLSRNKLGIHRVIPKFPAPPVRRGAYAAKRFQKFEQADILMAPAVQNRERVDRDRRVDGDVLLVRGGRRGQKSHAGQQDGQELVRRGGGHFS